MAGLPLVHVSFRYRANRTPVVAKGVIAIGQFAVGGIVLSQLGIGHYRPPAALTGEAGYAPTPRPEAHRPRCLVSHDSARDATAASSSRVQDQEPSGNVRRNRPDDSSYLWR